MRNLTRGYSRKDLGVSYVKEKQLRVNMVISKLKEKVKEHQEKVIKLLHNHFETDVRMIYKILVPTVLHTQFHSAAKIAGSNPMEWMKNIDRWIVEFLEKFEEGCHMMETAIKGRIQEGLKRQGKSELNLSGEDSDSDS